MSSKKRLTIKIQGEHFPLTEICRALGLRYGVIYQRIKKSKWPIHKALNYFSEDEILSKIYELRGVGKPPFLPDEWVQKKQELESKNKELESIRPRCTIRSKRKSPTSKRNSTIEAMFLDNGMIRVECDYSNIDFTKDEIRQLNNFASSSSDPGLTENLKNFLFSSGASIVDFKILYYFHCNSRNKKIKISKVDIASKVKCGERSVFRSIDNLIKLNIIREDKGIYTILI